jgi:hypothetical protein
MHHPHLADHRESGRLKTARLLLAASLLAAVPGTAAAQTAQSAKLAGMSDAVHVVVTVDSLAQSAGIHQDSLRAQIESALGDAGFTTMSMFGGSSLMVEVHAFQVATTAMLVYDVGVEYHTFVVPARQLSGIVRGLSAEKQVPVDELTPLLQRSVDAALYRRAVYGVGPRTRAGGVANVVLSNLKVFLADFRAANPR